MLFVAEISTRNQLGGYLAKRGLLGEAVEVGTHRGDFAKALLEHWEGKRLHCVDPWANSPGYEEQAKMLWGGAPSRDDDMQEAIECLSQFRASVRMLRATSAGALAKFMDYTLDFVHIDGDHSYDAVKFDVREWWAKLRSGGVMAVHDFVCPGESDGLWGRNIQPVVLAHAAAWGVNVEMIVEEGGLPWTALMRKP